MLIHVGPSAVADAVSGSVSSVRSLDCIENLLRAHHARKHIVSFERGGVRALEAARFRLSAAARAALGQVQGARREVEGLRRDVSWQVELGLGPSFRGEVDDMGTCQVIRASLHHFDDFERAGRSVLLAENLTDAEIYVVMGRALAAARGWNIEIAFHPRGGGGSTLAGAFVAAAEEGRLVLAVADSDRRHPGGTLGDTAHALLRAGRGRALQMPFVLHVRAAENLIPFAIYEEALAPHPVSPSVPECLQMLDRTVPRHVLPWRAHADLKHGLRWVSVQRMDPGPEEELWSALGRAAQRDRCRRPTQCRAEGACSCALVEGLGTKALERVAAWMRGQAPRRIAHLLCFDHDSEFDRLCSVVAAWGCAPPARSRA